MWPRGLGTFLLCFNAKLNNQITKAQLITVLYSLRIKGGQPLPVDQCSIGTVQISELQAVNGAIQHGVYA